MKNLMLVKLDLATTQQELIEQMQRMKALREAGAVKDVVCTISGFDKDRRELWQIPEVRAFCRRLVDIGFISYLNPETNLFSRQKHLIGAWAAFEVWLCAQGKMDHNVGILPSWLKDFNDDLMESNERANKLLGPYVHPPE